MEQEIMKIIKDRRAEILDLRNRVSQIIGSLDYLKTSFEEEKANKILCLLVEQQIAELKVVRNNLT